MKITRIETFLVPPRWLMCRVETDEGVVGWGEPVVEGRAETVRAAVGELSDLLLGQDLRGQQEIRVQPAGHGPRPAGEAFVVLRRHPEQLADHHDRQRRGQRADEVDGSAAVHLVDPLAGQLLDARRQQRDPARGERRRDEPAQPRVVRRVEAEEPRN